MGEAGSFIIGQGLAGTALAWQLWERGMPFTIVDRDEPVTCSKIAAGLITPITGMRLNLNWRFDVLQSEAVSFYRRLEERLGVRFYFPLDQVRLFRDETARELFRQRMKNPDLTAWVTAVDESPGAPSLLDPGRFSAPHGGFQQTGGGYLDTEVYLQSSRRFFEQHGCWEAGEVDRETFRNFASGSMSWRSKTYDAVVSCIGWQAAGVPGFDWLPFQSARGSIVSARSQALRDESRVINSSGAWLLPLGGGRFRLGPTYEQQFDPARPHDPAPEKLDVLRQKVAAMTNAEVEWEEVQTAVRPIVRGAKMAMGRHPAHAALGCFNGLGSKGALRAPWAARRFVEHWLDGRPLDPEVDVWRNG